MRLREERSEWEAVARSAYARAEREARRREQLGEALERIVDAWLNDRAELASRIAEARELLARDADATASDEARAHPAGPQR